MTPTEEQREYLRLARSGPGYLAWQKPGEDFRQSWFATEADALTLITQHAADSNIWVSMSEFPTRNLGRSAKGAERQSSFWIDVDAHEGGKYANTKAVFEAMLQFVKDTALPKPSIIHRTGHGGHAIWSFEKPLLKDDWLPQAEKLQHLADHHQLGADPITADAARILRVPGTQNFRDPCDPKPASMHVIGDGYVNVREFMAALDNAHAKLPPGALNPQRMTSNTAFEYPPTPENIEILKGMLACIDPDPAETGNRASWNKIVWGIAATGWEQSFNIAREWSADGDLWDETDFLGVWNSFDADRAEAIGFGTLVHRAKEGNYTGPLMRAAPAPRVLTMPPASNSTGVYCPVDWSVHGDIRNARHFAAMFDDRLLYIHGLKKWLRWSDDRWVLCDHGQEIESAKQAAQAMMADAATSFAMDQEKGKWRVREAMLAHHISRLKATLELARSEPGMSATQADLDANPALLGVGNGVVNLNSGRLITNRPDMLITKHCGVDYDLPTTCPRWLQFMAEVFSGDQATIDTVQHLLGYTLTGLNTEEIIVFCIGCGANGKSIFGNIINRIIGEYSKVAPHSLLAARRGDDHSARGDIAMLAGARLVSVNELPGGMHLDEQAVKAVAGREPISARQLYGNFFTFDPRFTVWVRTNHRPIIKGDDDGIWRRIVVLPFREKFEGTQRDPNLEAKLWGERSGILFWMIEGARQYLAAGHLTLSPAILAEQRQYRSDSDLLGEFLSDRTVVDPAGRVPDKELYGKWCMRCDSNGHKAGSKATFTQRLAERGFPIRRSNGRRFYSGLGFVT